jgi:hypothetical protein
LYAWTTNGSSSYNAGQFVLRHPLSHNFQGDLSYTLGNSIDEGSDAERSSEKQTGSGSYLTNSFIPSQSRGVSDFDTRHLITASGSYLLPFGRGQALGTHVGRFTDLLIGGWQAASIVRWTSGLPFSLSEGGFTTDWEIASYGVKTGNFKAKFTTRGMCPTLSGLRWPHKSLDRSLRAVRWSAFLIRARLVSVTISAGTDTLVQTPA